VDACTLALCVFVVHDLGHFAFVIVKVQSSNFERIILAGCCDLQKHANHSQSNNPLRYICTGTHFKFRSKQSQERIHDEHFAVLQTVNFTFARTSCNIVACLKRGSWCATNIHCTRELKANSPA